MSLAKAAKDYYLRKLGEISPGEDYYLRGGAATGRWRGNGATELGLEGTVTAEGLVRLFDGQHPATGEQLGRSVRQDGVAAWDVTFSADKSVSLLWALGDDETRQQVVAAFDEATSQALGYLESVASATRGASCQWPLVSPHWRPRVFPADGRGFSPRTVMRFPRGRSWDSPRRSVCEWFHPLAGGGVGESDGFAVGDDEVGVVHQPVDEG